MTEGKQRKREEFGRRLNLETHDSETKSGKIRGQYQTGGFVRSLSKSDLDKTESGRVLAICFEAKSPEKHIKDI